MSELCGLTIRELGRRLRAGEVTANDIVSSVAARIAEREPEVNAYITRLTDEASEHARSLTAPAGDASPLYGIPVAVKDNICTRGVLTSCGSRILHNFKSPYDAHAVTRLKAAQAVIMGKANLDEFAMGASCEYSWFGPAHNPVDASRVTGGSSGGSAAAVAYGGAIAALGSDTGGSVRQPAAFCGVVGLKPTYGRISRYGLVAFASSLDQIGVITKDVTDAALLLGVVAGRDEHDSTSVAVPVEDYVPRDVDIRGIRIGLPRECYVSGLDEGVRNAVQEMVDVIRPKCAAVNDVSMPRLQDSIPAYYLICMAEASSNLARYDSVRYGLRAPDCATLEEQYEKTRELGFADEVKRRILLGTFGLSKGSIEEYYGTGQKVRTLIRRDFERVFETVDVIVTPTAPTTAFKLGDKVQDPLAMYLGDIYTVSPSLAGLPAISIPCKTRVDGLPVGLQIIGRAFDEKTVLKVAYAFESI
jgi:aspartyl-tRNA(Asn)/glutamyl-tRNA(Gln) amidotransferase subunit A